MVKDTRPKVDLGRLSGPEGNAFCILGRCQKAASHAGWTEEQFTEFNTKATSGDYSHLLQTVNKYFNAKMR